MTHARCSIRALGAFGMVLVWAASACSSPEPNDCLSHPTFRLIVDAQDGHVPGDVRIKVRYGSGEEEFDAHEPDAPLKVVFCKLVRNGSADAGGAEDGGGAEGPIAQVTCDLWTDGAATVTVTAKGYPETVRELEAKRNDKCGLKLTESRITLEHEEQP